MNESRVTFIDSWGSPDARIGNGFDFEAGFRKIRNYFAKNINPELKKRRYYLSKSEKRRSKHNKAVKRQRRVAKRRTTGKRIGYNHWRRFNGDGKLRRTETG